MSIDIISCVFASLIIVAILFCSVGSILMIVLGSICVDTKDYSACGSSAGAICMIVFGVILFLCCCCSGGGARANSNKSS